MFRNTYSPLLKFSSAALITISRTASGESHRITTVLECYIHAQLHTYKHTRASAVYTIYYTHSACTCTNR